MLFYFLDLKRQNNAQLSILKSEFSIFAHYFKIVNNDTTSR